MPADGFRTGEDPSHYDDVSDGVERHSHLFREVVQRLISLAELHPGERLLDVGCGTGVLAALGAARVGPGGRVLGLDISEGMLARARADAARRGVGGWVDYRVGDAQALPVEDASFDAAVCLFTFMHLPEPDRAAREMHRALAPGGRVVLGVGGGARGTVRGWLHRAMRLVDRLEVARGRALAAPDLLNALVRSRLGVAETATVPAGWTDPRRALFRLLAEAGFRDLRCDWEGCVASFADPEEFWEVQNTYSSFARQRLLAAPAATVEAIRGEFLAACEAVLARGGRLVYPLGALLVSGRRA